MGTDLQKIELTTPGKDIESYLACVHSIPILTPEQEKELAHKLYDNDDLDAARQLVISHLRFVVHIARSYQGYGLPMGDIIQEGNVGLMKAVDRFDPNRGVKLVSFAVHWIKAEIHEYILKNWRLVKIATTKAQRKLFFKLRSKKKSLEWLTSQGKWCPSDCYMERHPPACEMVGGCQNQRNFIHCHFWKCGDCLVVVWHEYAGCWTSLLWIHG